MDKHLWDYRQVCLQEWVSQVEIRECGSRMSAQGCNGLLLEVMFTCEAFGYIKGKNSQGQKSIIATATVAGLNIIAIMILYRLPGRFGLANADFVSV